MNGCNGMQMEGRLNQTVRCRLDSRRDLGSSMLLHMYRCPPPSPFSLPLATSHQRVGMCRCWSVIVRDQARAYGNESAPPPNPLPGTWLFVQDSSPFCKATGDPWPLLQQTPGLNPNSYILMSCVQPCPPPDTLPDKDTCMLPLILSFSEFCVGGKTPAGH